jgi:uncharacterized protein YutE (UPF0331/DUF86 family)
MEKFEDLVTQYKEYVKKIKDRITRNFTDLSDEDIELFFSAIQDIYKNVKLPGNRRLVLQELSKEGGINLKRTTDVSKALRLRALIAGRLQNVDEEKFNEFAMLGDSGYSDLRARVITESVEREREGIDYIAEENIVSI